MDVLNLFPAPRQNRTVVANIHQEVSPIHCSQRVFMVKKKKNESLFSTFQPELETNKLIMQRNQYTLTLTLAVLSFGATAHSQVIFSDDFEGHTVGDQIIADSGWIKSANNSGNTEIPVVRDEATSTAFGTPNQFIELIDASTSQALEVKTANTTATYDALTMFSFDFYEPTGGGDSTVVMGYSSSRLDSGSNRARFTIGNGALGASGGVDNTYSLDTTNRVFMVFNDTLTTKSYFGQSIAAETAALWLQESGGSRVYAGTVAAANSRSTGGYGVGVTSFSSSQQTMYFDNVVLETVPEPSTLALLGLSGLLLGLRRRQRT